MEVGTVAELIPLVNLIDVEYTPTDFETIPGNANDKAIGNLENREDNKDNKTIESRHSVRSQGGLSVADE